MSQHQFVFVLMPFDKDFDDIYKLGIKAACKELNLYCERVDEQIFSENILERVYNQILKADIIISDMSRKNPNVFYETGYAHACDKRVILLTNNSDDIPFDLKQLSHIIYGNSISFLKEELSKKLEWFIANYNTEEVEQAKKKQARIKNLFENADSIDSFSEGLALVKLDAKFGYIDKTGSVVIPIKYDFAYAFSEGLAAITVNENSGYIDKTGKNIIPPVYNYAHEFSEGMAAVNIDGKWGYIDKDGNDVLPIKYDNANEFSEGLAIVKLDDIWILIDKKGEQVNSIDIQWTDSRFREGLAKVRKDNEGYIDKSGNQVIPTIYSSAEPFSEGLAVVVEKYGSKNGDYSFIDKSGKQSITLRCDQTPGFSEGLAAIKVFHKWGYIDKSGNQIIARKYFDAKRFSEGLAAVKFYDKWGYIDKAGNEVLVMKYDSAGEFHEGLAIARLNGKWIILDRNLITL